MTTIEITPLHDAIFSRARVTAKPVHGDFEDLLAWNFDRFTPPFIALAPPPINEAWVIALTIGSVTTTRTVTFIGSVTTWDGLTDVDPSTLEPVPVGDAIAEWEAVRDQLLTALERHEQDVNPHRAYDDIPDLSLLFENKVETGLLVDETIPDLTTVFDTTI